MTLSEILEAKGNKVWSVKTTQTVWDAVQVLVANKIGALLAFEKDGRIGGIISERDIMRVCHQHRDGWDKILVRDVMTPRVIICTPDDHADYVMGVMTQNRIRHIPVVKAGKLLGVISIGDVVKAQLKDSQYENQYLKEYLAGS